MGVDLLPHAVCMLSFKFGHFLDDEKLHLRKNLTCVVFLKKKININLAPAHAVSLHAQLEIRAVCRSEKSR